MKSTLFLALVLAAAPLAAFAQSDGQSVGTQQGPLPQRAPNLANPQAEDNAGAQSQGARTTGSSGEAASIPTPTLNRPSTPTNRSALPH